MPFFAIDSRSGHVRYGAIHWRIGVRESAGDPQRIGAASEVGKTPTGLAISQLRIQGCEVPGRWIIVDGQFMPVEDVDG